jgi:hypothetical protein
MKPLSFRLRIALSSAAISGAVLIGFGLAHVVHERGEHRRVTGQRQRLHHEVAARLDRLARDPVHQPRVLKALAQHQHRGHGDNGGMTEPGKGVRRLTLAPRARSVVFSSPASAALMERRINRQWRMAGG